MILGDVEETVTTIELDEETFEEIFKVCGVPAWVKCIYINIHYTDCKDQLYWVGAQFRVAACIQQYNSYIKTITIAL